MSELRRAEILLAELLRIERLRLLLDHPKSIAAKDRALKTTETLQRLSLES
jgi:hypothetical protein